MLLLQELIFLLKLWVELHNFEINFLVFICFGLPIMIMFYFISLHIFWLFSFPFVFWWCVLILWFFWLCLWHLLSSTWGTHDRYLDTNRFVWEYVWSWKIVWNWFWFSLEFLLFFNLSLALDFFRYLTLALEHY